MKKSKILFCFSLRVVSSRSNQHKKLGKSLEKSVTTACALLQSGVRTFDIWHSEEKRSN